MFQWSQVKKSTQKRLIREEGQHTCFILDEEWLECTWPLLTPVDIIISITSFPATCFLNHDPGPVVDLPQQKPELDWLAHFAGPSEGSEESATVGA